MAARVKTIEYAFQSRNTSLASATRYDFSAITLNIPETTSRTFRSVRIQVACRDTATSATSLTAPVVGIKLGATAFDDSTLGNPPGNTGESGQYVFERDVTSYFNTNFGSGGSQTCQVGVQFTGPTTINHLAKLLITYEYDDAASTHVKTVRIPLDSGLGALTATLVEIGTNQIPALDTFLPESSKTYRNIWFELIYNETTTGTTNDSQLGMQVDSGTEHLTGTHESGMASSCAGWYIWDQGSSPVWATNAVHAFKLRSSNITSASTFNHVGILLCITYEFDPTSSTIINSLVLSLPPIQQPGATTATDASKVQCDLWIEEPATITMVQSGALVNYSQTGAVGPVIKFGSASTRSYTDTNVLYCGASFLTHRIDSGGAGGAALTLARGKNVISWEIYIGTAGISPSGFVGLLYLNYTSGKASGGVGVHNHSTAWSVQNSQASGNVSTIAAAQWIYIPETNWFCNDLTFISNQVSGVANYPVNAFQLDAESAAGELTAGGWERQGIISYTTEIELGWYPVSMDLQATKPYDWERYYGDPETTRMVIEGSRRLQVFSRVSSTRPLFIWFTYHSITFTFSGTVSGSGSGTVNIDLFRASDDVKILTTSRAGNGSYSFTWYDSSENVFSAAREDSTHMGRSDDGAAS